MEPFASGSGSEFRNSHQPMHVARRNQVKFFRSLPYLVISSIWKLT